MIRKKLLYLMFFVLASCGVPNFNVYNHDEDQAAAKAKEFAQVAFIQQEYRKAYILLWEETKKQISFEKFQDVVEKMHSKAYPSQVTATEYEPIPGQAGIQIYLNGKNGNEEFFYRFDMAGTKESGYRVSGIFRGNGPYPPTKLRKMLKDTTSGLKI